MHTFYIIIIIFYSFLPPQGQTSPGSLNSYSGNHVHNNITRIMILYFVTVDGIVIKIKKPKRYRIRQGNKIILLIVDAMLNG